MARNGNSRGSRGGKSRGGAGSSNSRGGRSSGSRNGGGLGGGSNSRNGRSSGSRNGGGLGGGSNSRNGRSSSSRTGGGLGGVSNNRNGRSSSSRTGGGLGSVSNNRNGHSSGSKTGSGLGSNANSRNNRYSNSRSNGLSANSINRNSRSSLSKSKGLGVNTKNRNSHSSLSKNSGLNTSTNKHNNRSTLSRISFASKNKSVDTKKTSLHANSLKNKFLGRKEKSVVQPTKEKNKYSIPASIARPNAITKKPKPFTRGLLGLSFSTKKPKNTLNASYDATSVSKTNLLGLKDATTYGKYAADAYSDAAKLVSKNNIPEAAKKANTLSKPTKHASKILGLAGDFLTAKDIYNDFSNGRKREAEYKLAKEGFTKLNEAVFTRVTGSPFLGSVIANVSIKGGETMAKNGVFSSPTIPGISIDINKPNRYSKPSSPHTNSTVKRFTAVPTSTMSYSKKEPINLSKLYGVSQTSSYKMKNILAKDVSTTATSTSKTSKPKKVLNTKNPSSQTFNHEAFSKITNTFSIANDGLEAGANTLARASKKLGMKEVSKTLKATNSVFGPAGKMLNLADYYNTAKIAKKDWDEGKRQKAIVSVGKKVTGTLGSASGSIAGTALGIKAAPLTGGTSLVATPALSFAGGQIGEQLGEKMWDVKMKDFARSIISSALTMSKGPMGNTIDLITGRSSYQKAGIITNHMVNATPKVTHKAWNSSLTDIVGAFTGENEPSKPIKPNTLKDKHSSSGVTERSQAQQLAQAMSSMAPSASGNITPRHSFDNTFGVFAPSV